MVGRALMRELGESATGTFLTRPLPALLQLDARDASAVARALNETEADVIFVPAAEPNVDWCEQHPADARDRNIGPVRGVLAAASGQKIVAFSSDYVFDGADGPYGEASIRRPLSTYGRIKAELEELLLSAGQTVVRTTTVFGEEVHPAKNFVLRLVSTLRMGQRVRIPSDQISTPTYAPDLAAAVVRVAGRGGVWHIAGPDIMSRSDLAYRVADAFSVDSSLIDPTPTAALGQPAVRPLRAGLLVNQYLSAFGAAPVRPLRDALEHLAAILR